MRYLKYIALLAILVVPFALSQAEVRWGVGIGVGPGYVAGPPVCEYGYYDYSPYACAPYGYYGPQWFSGGVFIGAGPWYGSGWGHAYYGRGYDRDRFYGRGDSRGYYDRGGYRGGYSHAYAGGEGFRGGRGSEGFHGGGNYHGGSGSHGGGGFHGGGGGSRGGGGHR